MKQQPFLNDNDFFKSKELNDHGHVVEKEDVLEKSIPTVGKVVAKPVQEKIVPKEVIAFRKKVDNIFVELNTIIKDLTETNKTPDHFAELLKLYKDFKSQFEWKLNDAINYPNNQAEVVSSVGEKSSRVNLNKVKN